MIIEKSPEPSGLDPRISLTSCRAEFVSVANTCLRDVSCPSLSILKRSPQALSELVPAYKNFRQALSANPSADFTTRVSFPNDELSVTFPEGLELLPDEVAEILRQDLLQTAQLYAEATQTRRGFHLKPSTVVATDTHIHHVPVLSISWGGAGLAVDKCDQQTAQLEEGDFGLLSPRMPHRSPYRSQSGRMVMFVAPPNQG